MPRPGVRAARNSPGAKGAERKDKRQGPASDEGPDPGGNSRASGCDLKAGQVRHRQGQPSEPGGSDRAEQDMQRKPDEHAADDADGGGQNRKGALPAGSAPAERLLVRQPSRPAAAPFRRRVRARAAEQETAEGAASGKGGMAARRGKGGSAGFCCQVPANPALRG